MKTGGISEGHNGRVSSHLWYPDDGSHDTNDDDDLDDNDGDNGDEDEEEEKEEDALQAHESRPLVQEVAMEAR